MPPRGLAASQPRQRALRRSYNGVNIPQAGSISPADQKTEAGIVKWAGCLVNLDVDNRFCP